MKISLATFGLLRIAVIFPAVVIFVSCKDSKSTAQTSDDSSTALAASQSGVSPGASVGMNAVGIPAASIEAVVNPQHVPPYNGPTGSIEGTVSVTGDPPPDVTGIDSSRCANAQQNYGKAFREGAKLEDGSRTLGDVLVVVTEYSGFVAEPKPAKLVTITDCTYGSRTIDLTFGQKLEIVNHDPKGFYAPVLSNNEMPAVMVPAPNGDPITIYPGKPGYSRLSDRMGGPLAADVYTLLQPLHTVSDVAGHFRIDGVPVGNSKINARLKAVNHDLTKPIVVHDGVVEHVDLVLEYKTPVAVVVDAGPRGNIR